MHRLCSELKEKGAELEKILEETHQEIAAVINEKKALLVRTLSSFGGFLDWEKKIFDS